MLVFHHCEKKIPETINIRGERFVQGHGFRDFNHGQLSLLLQTCGKKDHHGRDDG